MFYRCECGKLHMISVLANFCPKCGLDLRFVMFRAGINRSTTKLGFERK